MPINNNKWNVTSGSDGDKKHKHSASPLKSSDISRTIKRRRQRRIQLAYTVVLMLISIGILWNCTTTSITDELYTKYYEMPTPSAPRIVTDSTLEIWTQAVQAFSEHNFSAAMGHYAELSNTKQFVAKSEVQFYLAICQLELEQYDDAINTFKSISTKSTYSLDTKWYLSLAYLKTNQLGIAKVMLTEIQDASGFKAAEAEMILLNLIP